MPPKRKATRKKKKRSERADGLVIPELPDVLWEKIAKEVAGDYGYYIDGLMKLRLVNRPFAQVMVAEAAETAKFKFERIMAGREKSRENDECAAIDAMHGQPIHSDAYKAWDFKKERYRAWSQRDYGRTSLFDQMCKMDTSQAQLAPLIGLCALESGIKECKNPAYGYYDEDNLFNGDAEDFQNVYGK